MRESQDIEVQLKAISTELLAAITSWEIADKLKRSRKTQRAFDLYPHFFENTCRALQRTALQGFARVLDTHPSSVSLVKLMGRIQENPEMYNPGLQPKDVKRKIDHLRSQLNAHSQLTNKIRNIRNKTLGHRDPDPQIDNENGLVYLASTEDWDAFTQTLQMVVNQLMYDYNGTRFVFRWDRCIEDTRTILEVLEQHRGLDSEDQQPSQGESNP